MSPGKSEEIIAGIFRLFRERGNGAYFGESISETEHALQAAALATRDGARPTLIVSALLHDIGHLLHGLDETIAEEGIDGHHELGGAAWLERHFGPEVTDPVRLHVAAKQYLCATEPDYLERLSPASLQSLRLQGGPFNAAAVAAFEAQPYAQEAVALRRWDDEAKVPGLVVPGLDAYREHLALALSTAPKQRL